MIKCWKQNHERDTINKKKIHTYSNVEVYIMICPLTYGQMLRQSFVQDPSATISEKEIYFKEVLKKFLENLIEMFFSIPRRFFIQY